MEEEYIFTNHFQFIESENVSKCFHCKSKLKGKNISNIKRHLVDIHPQIAADSNIVRLRRKRSAPQENSDEVPIKKRKLGPSVFVRCCVELVAFHLLPYNMFSFPAFKQLVETHEAANNITINKYNVRKYVDFAAAKVRDLVKKEIKQKIIALKIDIASRLGRSVLGVHAQFFSGIEHKLVTRTLSMIELKRRHTAQHINFLISSVLENFDIDPRNISCITSDNGSNVIAAIKRFQECQNSLFLNDELIQMQENYEDSDEEDEYFDENGPSDLPPDIKNALTEITSLTSLVRCSIHTLQLAVHDSINEIKRHHNNYLTKIRSVVKNMKSSTYVEKINSLNIKIPGIDIVTRWNSSFIMIHKLIGIENDMHKLYEFFSGRELDDIQLSREHWDFMKKFHSAFLPCYELTLKLQSSEISMGMVMIHSSGHNSFIKRHVHIFLGDFFFMWKKCLFNLKESLDTGNDFSKIVSDSMNFRMNKMLDGNDILLASLYIDPRYNYESKVWNEELKSRAEVLFAQI